MRYSRDSGFFAPHGEATSRRTSGPVSSVHVTERPVRLPGTPLRGLSPSADELIARRLVSVFIVPALILLVAWVAGSGFVVSVPVEREADDRVRGSDVR
jgi:hypothetical protein